MDITFLDSIQVDNLELDVVSKSADCKAFKKN